MGVFASGDVVLLGSMDGTRRNGPVVGTAASPRGAGHCLVTADGEMSFVGVPTFNTDVYGCPGRPMAGIAATSVPPVAAWPTCRP